MATALITGASAGLGEQFAYALARKNYELVLVARRLERLQAVAAKAREFGAGDVRVIRADLTEHSAAFSVHQQLSDSKVQIDYLVNNAGFGSKGSFSTLSLERELKQIDLNIAALVTLTRLFLPAMIERGHGTIINVASTAAFQALPYMATYAASKAFVLSFSQAIAEEVKKRGVSVMALCPGPTHTEFQAVAGNAESFVPDFIWMDAQSVVARAVAAAETGRRMCVTGTVNRMMAEAARFAPRTLVTRVAAIFNRP